MGERTRSKYENVYQEVRNGATPITIITKEFTIESRKKSHYKTYKITQFPIRVAEASTAHKYQGLTVESYHNLVLHGYPRMPAGMAYVMLSRAKNIESVYLHPSFKTNKILCNKEAKEQSLQLDQR